MPRSAQIFLFCLAACALLLCLYYNEIEQNVSLRFGPRSLGPGLRNLRSSEDISSQSGASKVTPSASVQDGDSKFFNGTVQLTYQSSARNANLSSAETIHIAAIFYNAPEKSGLKWNFCKMIDSMLQHCSKSYTLHIHLLTDPVSWDIAKAIISDQAEKQELAVQASGYYVDKFAEQFSSTVETLQRYFSAKPGTYYSQSLFYLSVHLMDIVPSDVSQLIFIDVDTEFREGVEKLYHHFTYFNDEQLMGLAPELSPVYRHILYVYRNKHKATLLGEPKGKGFPGYNSGVVLMKLDRLRQSELYISSQTDAALANLTTKYSFKGHLGDQDFYTLIALEYPHLFYTLPCNWNRQLCKWWKSKGYEDIFDSFHECKGFISLYHGNCNSQIPVNQDAI